MYQEVFSRLALAAGGSEVSQPIAMNGANSAKVESVIFAWGGGMPPTYYVVIQESNDMENWTTNAPIAKWATAAGTDVTSITSPGYYMQKEPVPGANIAAAFIRLKVFNATTASSVVSVGVNLAQL